MKGKELRAVVREPPDERLGVSLGGKETRLFPPAKVVIEVVEDERAARSDFGSHIPKSLPEGRFGKEMGKGIPQAKKSVKISGYFPKPGKGGNLK
jgi:hypothetical protein